MVAGCLARAIHCLVQVLYALNEMYYISEKKLARDIASFGMRPERFLERVYAILGEVGSSSVRLQEVLKETEGLYDEMVSLTGR